MARKRRRSSKKTLDLCFHRTPEGKACFKPVKYLLSPNNGQPFKVCPHHLDWGLDYCGTPAEVKQGKLTVKIKKVDDEDDQS